ncbi:DUF3891 family protein [Costertonia aggregata]|uniref:DUF3891 family protein n=1 Tax=Costertonia aggregata TaxID=343403 RepID=A0A7H9ASP5_9FLAO|nr:DUF3891 family protein [Costertonia aggregata]QLG46483.1 DUF3891 family protein [Costertonia aggregata]
MLINFIEKGLEVITHPAHGLLSGKIAQEIHPQFRYINWLETLIAIVEHDDEQLSPEKKNSISKIGMPLDFLRNTLPPEKALIHARAVFDKVFLKSSWAAMLLSYHLEFLYEDAAKESKEFKEFLDDMKQFRIVTSNLHQVELADMKSLYQIMVFSDRLSLVLCQNEVPELGRKLEINQSIEDEQFFISQQNDDSLNVEPWVFKRNNFELFIDTRIIAEIKFKDENEFTQQLMSAPLHLKKWRFSKPSQ